MIKYQLICDKDHEFEGWFSSSSAYDSQLSQGLVECPICASHKVRRALMAPNLNSPKMRRSSKDKILQDMARAQDIMPDGNDNMAGNVTTNQPADTSQPGDAKQAMAMAMTMLRSIHKKIQADFTNVGDKFADEARKMHYGEKEAEPIFGTSTDEEREALADEGIEFHHLPDLPKDH